MKEKGNLKLFIERNLFEDFCRDGQPWFRDNDIFKKGGREEGGGEREGGREGRESECLLSSVFTVPDLHIEGTLSAIHVILDKSQLELIKGLITDNLGENMEDFEKPSTVIRDPIAPVREGGEGGGGIEGENESYFSLYSQLQQMFGLDFYFV